ncbi:DNA-directed_RNA polymerase subunit [Hexamita inflata]|uniref:DNA-directed RNA polymerase subunit n=1 Tax=Hexamita inflata TaxID=28002 RepID=A0AA86PVA8_9EUKA|nr:DNA-directed RNA polymerase subunit [Hexamita inflata]
MMRVNLSNANSTRGEQVFTATAVTIGSEMRHGTSSFDLLLDCGKLPVLPDTEHPGRVVQNKKLILQELDIQNSVAQDAISNVNPTRGEHVFTVVTHKTSISRSQTFSRYSTHKNSIISGKLELDLERFGENISSILCKDITSSYIITLQSLFLDILM